jgi:hypothetical protein
MKNVMLTLLFIWSALPARADTYTVPQMSMNDQDIGKLASDVFSFAAPGTYYGKTSAGNICGLQILKGFSGNGLYLRSGYPLSIDPPAGQGDYYLLAFSKLNGQLHLVAGANPGEGPGRVHSFLISATHGVPTSVTWAEDSIGVVGPGQVYSDSDFVNRIVCNNLVKSP